MSKLALVDTNILIYAHDSQSSFFKRSHAFLKLHIESNDICFTLQNILEAYRIWTQKLKKPIKPKEAWEIGEYYRTIGVPIIFSDASVFDRVKDLSERYAIQGVHIFDTLLVATMIENGISTLYTANVKDFSFYKEIQVINPFKD